MVSKTVFQALALCYLLLIAGGGMAQSLVQATGACLDSAKAQPKTLNSVVDTRCSLVAFEVCMNKSKGVISQSQDAKRQCAVIKEITGPNTCMQPCIEALGLPIGGDGVVGRYTGLTKESVDCYNSSLAAILGKNEQEDECRLNNALACLQNASALPAVNAAILRERKNGCKSYASSFPGKVCVACSNDRLRVDYDQQKKHDVLGVDILPAR